LSIYNDPIAYAREYRVPVRLSRIWCEKQLALRAEQEAASICPKCRQPALVIEHGNYEEGTRDYVYCDNDEIPALNEDGEKEYISCDFVSEFEKQFEPLAHWWDFDPIIAMNCGTMDGVKEFGGLAEWLKFVRDTVKEDGRDKDA